ncbi:MAG: 2-C-methyl-D-erythritol 4-phosphate cytidylyltransferase [Plesiomonas sp.]|uniref:2-C-methyl-D-erythritol 4-phosphate cytidylyltransferase n=1 Tax=Plesiomonas sp. TaxID=2486279 RepID=UPI003F312AE0
MMTVATEQPIHFIAIIPAAGIGSRMQSAIPKQYLLLQGLTILEHTAQALLRDTRIASVIIALHPDDCWFDTLSLRNHPRIRTVVGGNERADSVLSALRSIEDDSAWVLVHDAARPCLHANDLDKLLTFVDRPWQGNMPIGAILASPVRDTMKRGTASQTIDHTVERTQLWHALTPQMFPARLLCDCLEKALAEQAMITDEASALEFCGFQPYLVSGRADNIKVTQPEDLELARFYLAHIANVIC